MEHFKPYIYGRHFKVVTDHHSLCHLLRMKDPKDRLARWIMRLQPYDFEICHIAGKVHTDVDPLSRNPVNPPILNAIHLKLMSIFSRYNRTRTKRRERRKVAVSQ